ncbi:hypothetical protein [Sphingobacterium paucimobilis]|uniref:Lipocalin-like domain-containing protein n=1 Tax=Sphingobacterium paucimobilis HER1398 TaxID=1346330 RepID=U2HPP9_9SPHI|nr:hypothetical protein [Sphingobacterium paucimobilis]ERJ57265.1 hypothetical protein M472_00650 [Sphingobacterium paucimobilis HER1398]
MKTTFKILSLLLITVFMATSCSKDDDPADNDLFIGKYEGTISFKDTNDKDKDVSSTEGSVTVTKVGDNYSFNFSNGIPTIKDISMKKGDNNTIMFSDNGIGTITVTASKLSIAFTRDGQAWLADCKR